MISSRMVVGPVASPEANSETSSSSTILEEIIATTTSGAEGSSSAGFSTVTNLTEGVMGLHSSPSGCQVDAEDFLAAQEAAPTSIRPKKVFLSPALLWLEEEGLPTAEKEARDRAFFGGEMDEEVLTRRAMKTWKRMSMEEKAVW